MDMASPHARGNGRRDRFGAMLRRRGYVTDADIARSLAAQRESGARIGDILASRGLADRRAVARVAAEQSGLPYADLDAEPIDPTLIDQASFDRYLAHRILPWRRSGDEIVFAAAEPDRAAPVLCELGERSNALIALTETRSLERNLISHLAPDLASRAGDRRPEAFSMRVGAALWQRRAPSLLAALFLALFIAAPVTAGAVGLWLMAIVLGLNGVMWAAALAFGRPAYSPREAPAGDLLLSDFRAPPRFTIMVPLYKEPEVAPLLLASLRALDYPPELLDIKLILETGDDETAAALRALDPPPYMEILTAPPGEPRTKPRALNFALEFARGEIIGIYDAEDRPAPDQLRRIAAQFRAAPSDVACIQARLGFYNVAENALSRFFEIEYATWFDVMLPGLRRLGLPVPLGGTSLFLRRGAIEALGGWDSYNVTEDADLGVMIARAGLRTELSWSLTEEEANCRAGPWVKQRSRWLKGYLATWLTHMRNPRDLVRDLGLWRTLGLNLVLLGAVFGYLALPLLWLASSMWLAVDVNAFLGPDIAQAFAALNQTAAFTLPAMAFAALLGVWRRGRRGLAPMVLCLPLYWPLGAAAAYLALFELVFRPFKWRKTSHGIGRIARKMRSDALARLNEIE